MVRRAEPEEREPTEMKIEVIVANQHRATCEECGAHAVITPAQGSTGKAICYGDHISYPGTRCR
jgi:hypothetical protein